jgi:hypothetical protein
MIRKRGLLTRKNVNEQRWALFLHLDSNDHTLGSLCTNHKERRLH